MDLSQVLATRPCAIVGHTLGVESAPLAVILAQGSKTTLQDAHVVTWNVAAALADVGSKPSTTKRVTVLSYDTDLAALSKLSKAVVVFDNAEQCVSFIGLPLVQTLVTQGNIVLILFNMLTPEAVLLKIRDALPGAYLSSATFADHGQDIRFEVHETKMVPAQDLAYQLVMSRDAASKGELKLADKGAPGPFKAVKHEVKSLQIENLVYPTEVQTILEREAKDAPTAMAIVARYGEHILDTAPKLRDLVLSLMLNREQRHVVFTRYAHHYGADVVAAILKLYGFTVFTLQHNLTVQQRSDVVKAFNADIAAPSVLVTTVVFPDMAPTNISHIHMLDGAFDNMPLLLNACYKYANYPILAKGVPPILTIDYYICQRLSGADAGGAALYRTEITKWSRNVDYWVRAMKAARPIVVADDGRLAMAA